MIGVLLAGGAATRLPNKPLLPQRDFSPVCFSGMEYLLRHQVSHINVVTSPNSVVVDIIDEHYRPLIDLVFTYQEEPTGVGDAINLVDRQSYKINGYCTDDMMIVMADNIYPRHEHLELNLESFKYDKMAIVRGVSAWRLPHLVRIGKDNRPTRTGPGRLALSTPWFIGAQYHEPFSAEAWRDFGDKSKFIELPGKEWWDVGTPETYGAYWRGQQ